MWKDTQAVLKYKRGDASDHVPLEPEVPAQDANELWSVQRYSTEECDGRSNSSSTQVQLVMRGKRRFQEELNLNRLAVQFSAVQHRVSAASCGHDPEDDLDRNHAQVEEGCRDCPHFPSPHVNLTTRNHSTTRKSWRSDAPIILPGWEYHTGGSRSKPTVHRCRPKTGGCGLLTRTQNEPTKQHGSGVENQQISTLEKTKSYQHSILSSLTCARIQRVSPFYRTSRFADSEEFDFHVWFSPGFLMQ